MDYFLKFLIRISVLHRKLAFVTLKILKLLKKNRGYFNIGNNKMFLDFLDPNLFPIFYTYCILYAGSCLFKNPKPKNDRRKKRREHESRRVN